MKVACDIDGVILDTIVTFCELFNKKYGTNYQRSDVTKWEFYIDWNIPEDDIWDIFYQIYKDSMSTPFIDDKIPTIMRNLNQIHDLSIVSARVPQYRDSILEKLQFHGIKQGSHYNELILLIHKPYDIKIKQDFEVFIDDNPKLAEAIIKQKEKILLLYDQPWNQEIYNNNNVIRVKNWLEIENYFNKR